MFSGAGCLPMSMPQSAWPALHLQVSVTDWSPLRIGGFTTSIRYAANIASVNTTTVKDADITAAITANSTVEQLPIAGIKNPHFMRVWLFQPGLSEC